MEYVIENNIRLSNNSWGSCTYTQAMYDVIEASQAVGHVFVASAGNDGQNTDVAAHYPSSYDLPNIISVAATDNDDALAWFSNYGPTTVDLGAPGVTVYSTVLGTSYGIKHGTSMSAPHVTGVLALLMSRRPDLTWEQARDRILNAVRPVDSLLGITVSGGVVNATNVGDCNGNGIADEVDITGGTSDDCSGNGLPDECEPDCNGNEVADSCDVFAGTSQDCNGNVIPDECEPDCNSNDAPDSCDVADGTSEDCNNNVIPDECELAENDCNGNGVPDDCDITGGTSLDCTENGVPDECDTLPDCNGNGAADFNDICYATSADCNVNGVPDECDITEGTSENCNDNLVPDECELGYQVVVLSRAPSDGFIEGFAQAGYFATFVRSGTWPSDLSPYEILVLAQEGYPPVSFNDLVNEYVAAGGGLIIIQDSGYYGQYSGHANPVIDTDGWLLRSNTQVVDFQSPLVAGLSETSTLVGWSTFPTFEPGTDVAINWASGVPMAATYAYGAGRVVYFNNLWVSYAKHWEGDLVFGTALMRNALKYAGGVNYDCNDNRVPDSCDIAEGTSEDCSGNGIPDECEPDCNENDVADSCDILAGTSEDCGGNGNGIPDECEPDCNENGAADTCDIASGTSEDCGGDGNGIPDECEPDCNENGTADTCDIAMGTSEDCTGNEIPDECEPDCNGNLSADSCDLAFGTSEDCNGNAVPDECDIAGGTSTDCNDNDVPDTCDPVPRLFAMGFNIDVAFLNGLVELGYDVETANVLPGAEELGEYDVVVWAAHTTSAHVPAVEAYVYGGGGLVLFQRSGGNFPVSSPVNPVGSAAGWEIRSGTMIADWSSPLAYGLGASSALGGYATVPVLKSDADAAVDWNDGSLMAATYSYGAGNIVLFNDFWAWYGHNWCGDTPYGLGLMQNALRYVDQGDGMFDCNHNGAMDTCDIRDGTSTDVNGNDVPDECDACGVCSDGVFCNGLEFCDVTGTCRPGPLPCPVGACNEEEVRCEECEVDAECDDGLFCTGVETCVNLFCAVGADPCGDQYCRESDDQCVDCLTDAHCDDDDPCNGVETCNALGDCEPGPIDDCNGNDVDDACDLAGGTSADCNGNVTPDECDVAEGTSEDCNNNDVPDECEPDEDCNGNAIQDICDIAGATSEDCNGNNVPDECEPDEDCNENGIQDICDIAGETSSDCNGNVVPDECDLAGGTSLDANGNSIPDECEVVPPLPEDSLGITCVDDGECEYLAACVSGVCYAPKHRYISLCPNPEQVTSTARRIKLESGETIGWVGAPYERFGLTLAQVVPSPVYDGIGFTGPWPDVLHVTGCEIATGQIYRVQAIVIGQDIANEGVYSGAVALHTPSVWGDTVSICSGDVCRPPNDIVGLDDIMAGIRKYQGIDVAPLTWLDLDPSSGSQGPDQLIGLGDIMACIAGFQGESFPGDGPLDCP